MPIEYVSGIFIEECNSRFLSKVNINGTEELCYISSSSKLAHFIQLAGLEVLLTKNTSKKSKTKYTVHAVKFQDSYVLLNLSYVNNLLMSEFSKVDSIYSGKIHREKYVVSTIKADFYIDGEQKIVIEAKGIISEEPVANLPSMKVERAVSQLGTFSKLLNKGYSVHYYVVLMNPIIERLQLNKEQGTYYWLFKNCLNKGMHFFIYKTVWNNKHFSLVRDTLAELSFMSEIS